MGAEAPKLKTEDVLADLEDRVKDAIIAGGGQDKVLNILIEIALADVREGRPLFDNPLHEPIFYRRYFRRWVVEGYRELEAIEGAEQAAFKMVAGPGTGQGG